MKYIISENQYKRLVNEQLGIISNLIAGARGISSSAMRNMGPTFRGLPKVRPQRFYLGKEQVKGGRFGNPQTDDGSLPYGDNYGCLEFKTEKEIVKELFDLCLKRSVNENLTKIDGWVKRLRKSVSGLGTSSDFMKVLSEIKTLDELSSVIKRYPMTDMYQRGESLFDAISGEMKISWMDIIKSLINFIVELEIQDCKDFHYSA
jgi:hypothetical protein